MCSNRHIVAFHLLHSFIAFILLPSFSLLGSSPVWFPSNNCILNGLSSTSCADNTFDKSKSSTFVLSGYLGAFSAQYGDGTSVSGAYVDDTLKINILKYNKFLFGLIDSKNVPNYIGSSTGILGLAPQQDKFSSSLLNFLSNDKSITTKQFSIYYPSSLRGGGQVPIYIYIFILYSE